MNIKQTLKQFGLNEKEADIYLACLQLGNETVLNIAAKANVKRPTTYNILEDLITKGLVARGKINNKNIYIAEKPKKLLNLAEIKKNNIEQLLPELNAIYNVPRETSKPSIKVYEGIDAVKAVYLDILNSIKGKEKMRLFGSIGDIEEHFKDITNFWIEKNRYKKYYIYDLINKEASADVNFMDNIRDLKNPNYKIKVLPDNYKFFNADNIIYKNKIIIISVKKDITATLIENKDIANCFKTIFDLAWNISEEI